MVSPCDFYNIFTVQLNYSAVPTGWKKLITKILLHKKISSLN